MAKQDEDELETERKNSHGLSEGKRAFAWKDYGKP